MIEKPQSDEDRNERKPGKGSDRDFHDRYYVIYLAFRAREMRLSRYDLIQSLMQDKRKEMILDKAIDVVS